MNFGLGAKSGLGTNSGLGVNSGLDVSSGLGVNSGLDVSCGLGVNSGLVRQFWARREFRAVIGVQQARPAVGVKKTFEILKYCRPSFIFGISC